jgi:uncharacterized Zn-binding protein involved in type VI secretion
MGPAIRGSSDVNVNRRPALRIDDPGIHAACCGTNTWTATTGSMTVLINGKGAHRIGDQNRHCGGMGQLIEGSPNVIVGESGGGGGGGSSARGGSPVGSAASGGRGGGAPGKGAAGPSGGNGAAAPGSSSAAAGATSGVPADVPDSRAEPDELIVRIIDAKGAAVGGVAYELTMPDGSVHTGNADGEGIVHLTELRQRGECRLVLRDVEDSRGSS